MHVAAGGRSHFVVRIQQLLLMAREQFILQLVIYTALPGPHALAPTW